MIILLNKLFVLLMLFLAIGCTSRQGANPAIVLDEKKNYAEDLVFDVRPKWFTDIKRFSLDQGDSLGTAHMFYDVNPKLNLKARSLNVVVTTPRGSEFLSELDVASGQIYASKKLCGTYDSTKKYNSSITTPGFHVGIVPRFLDQLNMPQKVLVFGGDRYITERYRTHSFDIRIIGGYVERICPKGACLNVSEWNSRLVLIGVKRGDLKYQKVTDMKSLRPLIDWSYFVAFLKNGFGKNKMANNYYQAFQSGQFVSGFRALNYLKGNSNFFSLKKMKTLKKSCYSLYDYMYKNLSHRAISDLDTLTIKDYAKKKKLKASLAKDGKGALKKFSQRFRSFYKEYRDNYITCSKMVYASNINDKVKRHWFFYHMRSVYLLNDLGFSYRCGQRKWTENSRVRDNKMMYPLADEFLACSNEEVDEAIALAPKLLESLALRANETYRYVTYDKISHKKLYSWVKHSNKRFKCEKTKYSFYPRDIKWKR